MRPQHAPSRFVYCMSNTLYHLDVGDETIVVDDRPLWILYSRRVIVPRTPECIGASTVLGVQQDQTLSKTGS